MRKLILYIAASLDGFIARDDGGLLWLEQFPNPDKNDYNYKKLLDSIDTTFMGNLTYKWLNNQNIYDPYPGKKNYVFSRNMRSESEFVEFINDDPLKFVRTIKNQNGKDIWLVGGGKLNALFLQNNLIDEIILTFAPIIIGKGIRLFGDINIDLENKFRLLNNESFKSGFVQLHYAKDNAG
ncbi:MAG: dihydrofolate reductase family protein [Bacteroidetes bacterium]|nr:dihydrofolate reductase family protein [Bacteroidota bacterium]